MKYSWNEPEHQTVEVWDTTQNKPDFRDTFNSLKYRLGYPESGIKSDHLLIDIARGLSEIMDALEDK